MRPHIDFVQAQNLPWQNADIVDRPSLSLKLLSQDPESGALSVLLRYPAGWSAIDEWLDADEEFFVLDGSLEINGKVYHDHTYANLPSGTPRKTASSSTGAVALTFFSKGVRVHRGTRPPAEAAAEGLVEFIDLAENVWDGDMESMGLAPMRDGARMRVLKRHPVTGETSYVTATIAFRRGKQAERHPVIQEFFLLAGELAGDRGVMQAGAYCVRPPLAKHAPYGSKTGALIFFRSLGGPQSTAWEETDPFTFTPRHNPIVPEELKRYAAQPLPRPPRY